MNEYTTLNLPGIHTCTKNFKKVILASDAIWFNINFQRLVPIEEYVENPDSYVNAMKRMKTLVTDEKMIISGHDNQVFSGFEKVTSRVVMIK